MKTNQSMNLGGKLRPECRQAWADYLARFISELGKAEGLPVWGLSMQNEPENWTVWESCLYSPEEERDFIARQLGPALNAGGLSSVHLLAWDFNHEGLYEGASSLYRDSDVAPYVWGAAVHWYGRSAPSEADRLHEEFPEKAIIFTEGCVEGRPRLGNWNDGETYARNMIGDFRGWISAWLDWNIALDTQGGPNHVGNYCDAPVLVDVRSGAVYFQPSFYYIGQFSKYVDEGAHVVASTVKAGLSSVSFCNPDGAIVTVVSNENGAKSFSLRLMGKLSEARLCSIPAHAIQTYIARPLGAP
jgi:glucosylceramidase